VGIVSPFPRLMYYMTMTENCHFLLSEITGADEEREKKWKPGAGRAPFGGGSSNNTSHLVPTGAFPRQCGIFMWGRRRLHP
jgi:hypothetical protein